MGNIRKDRRDVYPDAVDVISDFDEDVLEDIHSRNVPGRVEAHYSAISLAST